MVKGARQPGQNSEPWPSLIARLGAGLRLASGRGAALPPGCLAVRPWPPGARRQARYRGLAGGDGARRADAAAFAVAQEGIAALQGAVVAERRMQLGGAVEVAAAGVEAGAAPRAAAVPASTSARSPAAREPSDNALGEDGRATRSSRAALARWLRSQRGQRRRPSASSRSRVRARPISRSRGRSLRGGARPGAWRARVCWRAGPAPGAPRRRRSAGAAGPAGPAARQAASGGAQAARAALQRPGAPVYSRRAGRRSAQQLGIAGHRPFGGLGRRRRAGIGGKIDQRRVGLVADRGDERDGAVGGGADHDLLVEAP